MSPSASSFSYAEMVSRNRGFLTAEEQARLRDTPIFVCGVGGMGGACVQSLVRAGVTRLVLADIDRFELSNLNRQVFAQLDTVGREKTQATAAALLAINPQLKIELLAAEWTDRLDLILGRCKVVINGTDDVRAGILLYRKAREHGATVIDAYTAPLPSVTCVAPGDPVPEERLGFPTVGKDWRSISDADLEAARVEEILYVLVHSSSAHHVDLDVAAEVIAGRAPRPSLAPMVITSGNLMAFEAVAAVLGRSSGAGYRGYFLNPWSGRVERPVSAPLAWLRRYLAKRAMRKMTARG